MFHQKAAFRPGSSLKQTWLPPIWPGPPAGSSFPKLRHALQSTCHEITTQNKDGESQSLNIFNRLRLFDHMCIWMVKSLQVLQGSGPQTFWYQGPASQKTNLPWTGKEGMVSDDSSIIRLLCTLFLLLLRQLHLKSSGIRSQRLGTPA